MFGALVSLLITQSFDLMALVAMGVGRAASVGVLRLGTLLLAQGFDLATFSVMVSRQGATSEANPIVSDIFETFGMPAVVIAKLALVLLVSSLSVASSSRGGRGVWSMIGGLPLALAIAAGLIGGITNVATFLR